METRVLKNITSTLTDISVVSNDYYAQTSSIVLTTTDYLYMGQRHPFNHFYLKMGVANENALTLTLQAWDGDSWVEVVDILDETAGLTQDGFITFVPDKQQSWSIDDTVDSSGNEDVTGLGDVTIYDRYWLRLKVSAEMSAGSTLSWIGNIFSTDNDLKTEYPELSVSTYLAAWETGKTSWEEQHVRAAENVISDMISKNVIDYKGQILERNKLKLAAVHSVAEMIYTGLGDDYEDNRLRALGKYKKQINKRLFAVDKNRDGRLSQNESKSRTGNISR